MMIKTLTCTILLILFLMGTFSEPALMSASSNTAPPDTLIKMERTICFGTCPSYELYIRENGKITFIGKEFVEQKGRAEGIISDENLERLTEVIKESHFMEIPSNPECKSKYTDMPSVFLTIDMGDERNSVTHYHGCKGFEFEDELYELEEKIDSLAGVDRWIKG